MHMALLRARNNKGLDLLRGKATRHSPQRAIEADHPYRTTELAKVRLSSKRQRCGGDSNGDGYNVHGSVAKPGRVNKQRR
jgi:hypothetical protein